MAEPDRARRANEAGAAARAELQARYDAEDAEKDALAIGANRRGRHVVPARRSASPSRERVVQPERLQPERLQPEQNYHPKQLGAADIQQDGQQGGVGGGNNNFYSGEFGPQQGGFVQDQQGHFQQGGDLADTVIWVHNMHMVALVLKADTILLFVMGLRFMAIL
ncbi:hypothetical protein HYFRA_00001228 [Hymenoscyphus fraxineus]|uniref:Uncharacterized protein n=1 Tax=Hymenoscyphus fraxineus TaxID=746836 RepID=A0A9N9KS19_9HELO|nr:hypothetical protein HYFRA_00001228 [Hymenoscyphus fraxineus]